MTGLRPGKDKVFNRNYRIVIVPLVYVVYTVVFYVINPFSRYWTFLANAPAERLVLELFIGLIISWLITESSLISTQWLDKLMPWEARPLRRFFTQFAAVLLAVFIFLKAFDFVIMRFIDKPAEFAEEDQMEEWQFVSVSMLVAILLNSVHTGSYFLRRWKNSMLEAAQLQLHAAALKETAMQAQLQSLKLQLDPHFLFNNFSTLSVLIEEDTRLASSFLEKLSRVYRYMISNLNNDVISLQQELNFIQSYTFLIEIRHGENVIIQTSVTPRSMEKGIPPITLQLLIENAIKHNIASAQQPLFIRVYDDAEGNLVVSNTIQLIPHALPSTRLGLANIKERYALLFEKEVIVEEADQQFVVKLPLVNL